jgi:hypothetical protein
MTTMKRLTLCFAALIVALYFSALPVFAQHGHGGGGGGGGGAGGGHGAMGERGSEGSETRGSSHNSTLAGTKSPDELLSRNTKLSQKLQALLPSNMTVQDAAKGFKNLGQFVAAVHVSHNLGIPFDQLKSMMTGSQHDSLGKAIRALKPDADAKSESKKAEKEADDDIKESES